MRSATLTLLLLVSTAVAQTTPRAKQSSAKPTVPKPQDGAGNIPKAIRIPSSKAAGKVGTFNTTKLSLLTARVQYLTKLLNQSIIAAERFAHTSKDTEVQRRTHIRIASQITRLQNQWHKMSASEHVTDAGLPLASLTPSKGLAAAAKQHAALPKMGEAGSLVPHSTPSKANMKSTGAMVNKLAPGAKPQSTSAKKPQPSAKTPGASLFGRKAMKAKKAKK
jgi:hypothetical protein